MSKKSKIWMLQNSINNKKGLFYYSKIIYKFQISKRALIWAKTKYWFLMPKIVFWRNRDDNENQLIIKFEICAHDRSKCFIFWLKVQFSKLLTYRAWALQFFGRNWKFKHFSYQKYEAFKYRHNVLPPSFSLDGS